MLIRPATPADAAAMRSVCSQALTFEPDGGDLPGVLHNPSGRPEDVAAGRAGLVATASGEVTGVCLGGVKAAGTGSRTGHVDLLAVRPGRQGHGIGIALLSEMERLLAGRGAAEIRLGYNSPVFLWPGVDARYTPMNCLAERAGYERFAEAVDLVVDLSVVRLDTRAHEQRLAAAGLSVRRGEPAEAAALGDWLRRGPWGGSTWAEEAAAAMAGDPPRCHVASSADGYAGFAAHGVNRAGWFGPMGTLPERQNQGIGQVLLLRCLADIAAAGFASAQICWAGPVHFYSRAVGARVDRVYWAYRKVPGAG